MDAKMLSEKVERLRVTFRNGGTRPFEWRRSQLLSLRRMLSEHYADFEDAMQADLHKAL